MFKCVYLLVIFSFLLHIEAFENEKMINCYFSLWRDDRRQNAFHPDGIVADICTHISYAFFGLDNNGKFAFLNTSMGVIEHLQRDKDVLKIMNPKTKAIAVIGGEGVSTEHFSQMARDKQKRILFRESVIEFMSQYDFDGIDLHWLHKEYAMDRENFISVLRDLKMHFSQHNYELGITVDNNITYARIWYEIPRIAETVDFINVMTFGYTDGGSVATHDAPLRKHYGRYNGNVEDTINHWIHFGAPASKLNLGVTFTGRFFLKHTDEHSHSNDKTYIRTEKISAGKEFYTYKEICLLRKRDIHNKSIHYEFDEVASASYIVKDPNNWISYESPRSLEMKMDFLLKKGLKGVMIWKIEYDEHTGQCTEKYPLLNVIYRKLSPLYECYPGLCCLPSELIQHICYFI
ncbi:chitotriosidase-1-like [Haematobia irritans]|uniref:chitotriosidase-1-like n=1 Tax=Haematobia irritans TaxID=7368 RepID=UPI003F507184